MRRVFVTPEAPQRDALQEAAKWIRNGGLVAVPTDTLYALAVDPFNARVVARLRSVKGRPAGQAISLIAAGADQVTRYLGVLPPCGARLAEGFWPGPLTLLVPAPVALSGDITGSTGRVGVRVPAHDVARAICRLCEWPITATSANPSGVPATSDPAEVERTLGAELDLLIDVGRTPAGAPSTIVDVVDSTPRLVRAGAVSWDEIQAWLAA